MSDYILNALASELVQSGIIILLAIAAHLILKLLILNAKISAQKHKNFFAKLLLDSASSPIILSAWLLIVTGGVEHFVQSSDSTDTLLNFNEFSRTYLSVAIIVYFIINFLRISEQELNKLDKRSANTTTMYALCRVATVIFCFVAIFISFSILSVDLTGVITLGAVSAVVAATASKDLLANFFGAIIIFMDKPFAIGDKISSAEKKISGHVEHIGWRLTRIRTEDDCLLYVPNSVFASISIKNEGRQKSVNK